MKKLFAFAFTLTMLTYFSCTDDNNTGNGSLTLHFDNVVGTSNLQLTTDNTPYQNTQGEAFGVTRLSYYVSNIKLKRADGTIYSDPVKPDGSAGYYLIDENDGASHDVTMQNIPPGDYTEVTFTLGVDAYQVTQGAQTGALDPAHGLFWSWNSGYVFLALEGFSPVSTEDDHVFEFHVGGYKEDAGSNQVNNVRTITLGFQGDVAPVRLQHEPAVHLIFDLDKFLNGAGEQVTFAANASRHSPKACETLADNLAGAFFIDHVHAN